MVKDRYFYYKDGDRIIRKKGFLYTGNNPFKSLDINIFIVSTPLQYIAFIDFLNLVLMGETKKYITRTKFINDLENRLYKIDKRSQIYKLLERLAKNDLRVTQQYTKEIERYHNFKAEYMRQVMNDIKEERGWLNVFKRQVEHFVKWFNVLHII